MDAAYEPERCLVHKRGTAAFLMFLLLGVPTLGGYGF